MTLYGRAAQRYLETEAAPMGSCADDSPITFAGMHDEEVVAFAKNGSDRAVDYLLNKYRSLVESKARLYFLVGADHEDVVQEGMIGLYKAIRDFRDDKSKFRAFAELCVTRQIITAIKTATRQKHVPLNSYVSLHKCIADEESDQTLIDVIPDNKTVNPEEIVLNRQLANYIDHGMDRDLSRLEAQVLRQYLEGKTYKEMADELQCRTKSIDNALQRAKRKISERMDRD